MNAIETPAKQRWVRLLIIGLGTLLGPLDSAVNIAFPDITHSFQIPLQSIRWVVIAFVATYASLMLVFGRIGDLFGHHRVFGIGLAICIVSFFLCSFATAFEWLLVCRFFQGVGTAMVLSCGPALATNLFSEEVRPRVLGGYAMMFGLGGAIGPTLGGFLVDIWGWPAVFWFRLPIALIALVLFFVVRLPSPARASGSFDMAGAMLLTAATGLLLLTFSQLQLAGTQPVFIMGLCATTIIAIIAFVRRCRRSETPVIDLNVFGNVAFAWINMTNVIVNLVAFAVMLFVPYFLVRVSDLPLWLGGLVMATGPLGMMAAANLGGRMAPRLGANRLAFAGACLIAMATALISRWSVASPPSMLTASLLVHGVGLGLFQVGCLEIVATVLPKTSRGVAGSLAMVMRTIGVVLAASILTIVFTGIDESTAARGVANSFVIGFQTTFFIVAIALFAYIGISCLRPSLWFGKISRS